MGIGRYPRRMSGYAASARLQGGSPRFVPISRSGFDDATAVLACDAAARLDALDRAPIDLVGRPFGKRPFGKRPFGERLAARWDDLRETWAQTTFFLFDPESWR